MFKFILKSNTLTNPLIFLGGVSSVNLGLILDFIYNGEVQIFQEQLDSFLESARKLEIEGLLGKSEDSQEKISSVQKTHENNIKQFKDEQPQPPQEKQKIDNLMSSADVKMLRINDNSVNTRRQYSRRTSSSVERIDVASLSTEEIKDKIEALHEKIDRNWNCLVCDYTTKTHKGDIRRHVETHLDGLCYTCIICSKEFRSRNALSQHKNTHF